MPYNVTNSLYVYYLNTSELRSIYQISNLHVNFFKTNTLPVHDAFNHATDYHYLII